MVEVADDGLGLTEEQRSRLFQPFSQVHGVEQERRGTGLGLSISKGIVERHGGAIWVESRGPRQGATFSFTLPAKATAASPVEGATAGV